MLDTLNGTDKHKLAMAKARVKQQSRNKAARDFLKDLPTVLNVLDKLPVSRNRHCKLSGSLCQMLSYNDALSHPQDTMYCFACDTDFPADQAQWYLDPTLSATYDDSQPVVPVCPSCHADPASWLEPAYSVPGYLASRDCERVD